MTDIDNIKNKIYFIREQKVMLDRDLAAMYGVETRVLNQAVKRNIDRFPSDFMFQLTAEEWQHLKSQIVTSNRGGVRKLPYVFTELGVAMISSVLTSRTAIQVNIGIMRAFVAVRNMLSEPKTDKLSILESRVAALEVYINDILTDQNDINEDTQMQIELINESLAELRVRASKDSDRPRIGFICDKYK